MKHRHIRADRDEWVHVHRQPSGGDWSGVLIKVGTVILIGWIILQLLPYLLFAAGLWCALKIFLKVR